MGFMKILNNNLKLMRYAFNTRLLIAFTQYFLIRCTKLTHKNTNACILVK